jgi:AraC-like DNA-binding protein
MKSASKGRPAPSGEDDHRATVAAGFVTGLLSGARSRGLDAEGLVAAAGLSPNLVARRDARVPIADYVALYNTVARELGDEGFALFSAPLRRGTFEFLCRGMLGSRDLAEALDRAARFLRVVLPDLRVTIARTGAEARLEIAEVHRLRADVNDPCRIFAFEWLLRLLHGLASWFAARPLALLAVRFPYSRPPHAADYALIYTEHATFGGKTLAATFDAATLDSPVRRDAKDLEAFLVGAPGKIAMLYRRDRDLAHAVREILARSMKSPPTLDDAAQALGLSPRTLHRRLHDEGTSYRDIKDSLRREIALARLERSDASVAEIAAELGYSEPSAFFRAFQGWTGLAPTAHRRRSRS